MSRSKRTENEQKKAFLSEVRNLWPVAKGSLAEVRKPCIRAECPACASGRKHPAFIFSFKHKGRRRCMYVPRELVAHLRRAIRNGRDIEEWMSRSGYELIQRFREGRAHSMAAQRRRK